MSQYEGRTTIDVTAAMQLRNLGYSWVEVARVLSARQKRTPPFQASSVMNAVMKHKKRVRFLVGTLM